MRTYELHSLEWKLLFSIPLLIWAVVAVLLWRLARTGRYETRVNTFAIAGALLGYISLVTAWEVVARGGDWRISSDYSLFLLLTYPLSVVTPLAGIGQAGTLLYTLSYAIEHEASIEPMYGYVLGWGSVVLLFGGMTLTIVLPSRRGNPSIADRLLTVTIRKLMSRDR